ncbi:hypothetical protein SD71_01370 [Cohnella kolymensis]|uniref:Spore germination protein n=1 Tax=Cohnella kolymensis TaxID=1590652 RepID=A0ABR5A8Q6_9BACL|nr:spore germination protein [Cohnella kolymensis]KIL37355.1 hypothetical protein SD71_01370 [Cohnella kolymensis]
MPTVNNIFNIKILNVANNGSVNFGNTLHKGHTANQKRVGGNYPIGDANLNLSKQVNPTSDPDFNDQPTNQV